MNEPRCLRCGLLAREHMPWIEHRRLLCRASLGDRAYADYEPSLPGAEECATCIELRDAAGRWVSAAGRHERRVVCHRHTPGQYEDSPSRADATAEALATQLNALAEVHAVSAAQLPGVVDVLAANGGMLDTTPPTNARRRRMIAAEELLSGHDERQALSGVQLRALMDSMIANGLAPATMPILDLAEAARRLHASGALPVAATPAPAATLQSTRVCMRCHQQRDQHRDTLECQVVFDGPGATPRWMPSLPGAFGCPTCCRLLTQASWNRQVGTYNAEHVCVAHDPRPEAQELHRRNEAGNELARLRSAVALDLRLCLRCGERLSVHGQRMGCWTPSLEGAATCGACANPEMRVHVPNVGRQVCPAHLPRGLPVVIASIDPPLAPLQGPRGITFRDEDK